MRHYSNHLIAAALVVAAVVHLSAGRAHALGAIVIHEEGFCVLPGVAPSGGMSLQLGTRTADILKVENVNLIQFTCHATVTNLSGKAFTLQNVMVAIKVPSSDGATTVLTTDTHLTISASGEATLRAKFRFPDGPAAGN